jgi:hypothetical protein
LNKQKPELMHLEVEGNQCPSSQAEIGLCLFYLRHLPTFEILGLQFGISKTSANDIFHYWLRILREILPASLLEQVKNQTSDYEVVQELLTEFELLVDSTEQQRERPGEYKEQKSFFQVTDLSRKIGQSSYDSRLLPRINRGASKTALFLRGIW